MRILFSPDHDNLHVSPSAPGAYEWWYFDALSHDGRWALVVIYLLGSPMSPYYKAVVEGREPDPRDWCAVFVSLHERTHKRWQERAYAYNLYRGGDFEEAPNLRIGDSYLAYEAGERAWHLNDREPGLWSGAVRVDATFTNRGALLQHPRMGDKGDSTEHTWVCVAPVCRAEVRVMLPRGKSVSFAGNGYHDHNFGRLPYRDTDRWYWGRACLRANDGTARTAVYYHVIPPSGSLDSAQSTIALFGPDGEVITLDSGERVRFGACDTVEPSRSPYGLVHSSDFGIATDDEITGLTSQILSTVRVREGSLSEGPFYRRLPVTIEARQERNGRPFWTATGSGIGEVFQPARLCGPVVSRALWTRMRRRA